MKIRIKIYVMFFLVFCLMGYLIVEDSSMINYSVIRKNFTETETLYGEKKGNEMIINKKYIYNSTRLKNESVFFLENKPVKVPIPSLSEVLYGKSVELLNMYKLLGISYENGHIAILQDGSGKIIKAKKNDILRDNITVIDIDNKSVLLKVVVDNKSSEKRFKIYDITYREWK